MKRFLAILRAPLLATLLLFIFIGQIQTQTEQVKFRYYLVSPAVVTLEIWTSESGTLIKTVLNAQSQSAGEHFVLWDGTNSNGDQVASGVYVYKLGLNGNPQSKIGRVVFVK